MPMTDWPLVYVVLLAWNHLGDTIECLESIRRMQYPNIRLLLVDNGSTDGTADHIRTHYPDVEVIISAENVGIARGYNLGMAYALERGCDYVLVLNNDTTVDPNLVEELVKAGEAQPRAGILMPKIVYYDYPARLWSTGARRRRFPPAIVFIGLNRLDRPAYAEPREIDYAPSCALLIRRELMEKIGPFDSSFFFYYDDYDYCHRARQASYTIHYVPTAVVRHKVSVSTQHSHKPDQWWIVWGRSTAFFYYKHESLATLIAHMAWITVREAITGNLTRIPLFWKGAITGLREARVLYTRLNPRSISGGSKISQ